MKPNPFSYQSENFEPGACVYMFTKLTPSATSLASELFLKSQILGMVRQSTFQLIKMSNYLLIQNTLRKKMRLAHILGNRELNFYFMVENS